MNKVIVWGAGDNTKRVMRRYYFPTKRIEAIIDKDEKKQGMTLFGAKILPPSEISNLKGDLILIGTNLYFDEVSSQINSMNTGKRIIELEAYLEDYYGKRDDESTIFQYNNERMELLDNNLKKSGAIPQDLIEGAELLSSRFDAIDRMPTNMVVAEVGVAYGDFSKYIIDHMKPAHFYAVDFFNKDDPFISFWGRNDFEESGLPHEEWYRNKFSEQINNGIMTVCSGFSWDCLEKFDDDYFDYIYLDACHDYESVIKDIEVSYRKVKHGGYIQFNDYTLYDMYLKNFYGVVPAVNEFVNKTKSKVVYYCLDLLRFDDIVVRVNKH